MRPIAFHSRYKKAFKEKKSHDESLTFVAAQVAKPPEMIAQRIKLRDLTEEAKDSGALRIAGQTVRKYFPRSP